MTTTMTVGEGVRSTRLSVLVSEAESARIARQAELAGTSVSAYLRALALGSRDDAGEQAALRQIDALIERMENDIDRAAAELTAALVRMEA